MKSIANCAHILSKTYCRCISEHPTRILAIYSSFSFLSNCFFHCITHNIQLPQAFDFCFNITSDSFLIKINSHTSLLFLNLGLCEYIKTKFHFSLFIIFQIIMLTHYHFCFINSSDNECNFIFQ